MPKKITTHTTKPTDNAVTQRNDTKMINQLALQQARGPSGIAIGSPSGLGIPLVHLSGL